MFRNSFHLSNRHTDTPLGSLAHPALLWGVVNFSQQRTSPVWPVSELPQLGQPGSRSAELHFEHPDNSRPLTYDEMRRFVALRWVGTMGALLMGLGALGAGAFPVINNPYRSFPGGTFMARMLSTSSMITFLGVGFLVLAWTLMAPFVIARKQRAEQARVNMSMLQRTFVAWVVPIAASTPMFTQDIYSYLAQGSIVAHGMDPYAGGPVDLLGPDADIARSVPFIWAHSPSPYGPVALGLASLISRITGDSIVGGVFAHRVLAVLGLVACGWAVVKLARRCHVNAQAALWLGVLNPLCLLHLIGGIHNESILLGLLLVGLEFGLRGVDQLGLHTGRAWALIGLGSFCISCAGLVKITGFIALGFLGMALARQLHVRGWNPWVAIVVSAGSQLLGLIVTTVVISQITGINLGWVTGQGGAATIRSWMSISTDIGVIAGGIGMLLSLGDHTDAMLVVTRAAGVLLAGAFMVRMLFATWQGRIHPVGALGVSTFVLVILFPVVHPWYMLWAIVPLAAWANRPLFRIAVIGYSVLFSFFVLPRGLALPPVTILSIYVGAASLFAVCLLIGWWVYQRQATRGLN